MPSFVYAVFMLPFWITAALLILSTHRLTRLVTADAFPPVRKVREWIDRKFGSEHWLAYLTQCDWCASVWVAAGLTGGLWSYFYFAMGDQPWVWPYWVMLGLTASTVTGFMAGAEKSDD